MPEPVEKCVHCSKYTPALTNYCINCGNPVKNLRLTEQSNTIKVDSKIIQCFAAKVAFTRIFTQPDDQAEIIYVMGIGDALPILGEEGLYYQVALPAGETGFVRSTSGIVVEVGIETLNEPLGFARLTSVLHTADIVAIQPDDTRETIHAMTQDDRFPIVEENYKAYKVQLANGVRGWIHKSVVIRTLKPNSLRFEERSDSKAAKIGLIGLAIGAGLVQAFMEESQEEQVRRGVNRALQDRGY